MNKTDINMHNFDEVIERGGSRCCNIDNLKETFGREDLISLWIADMDFRTPDFVLDALRKRLEHPILGYPCTGKDYFQIVSAWVERLHSWKVDPENFRYVPGIVKGFALAQRCFLKAGDKVIIQPPVYHPFTNVTKACGFEIVNNPLIPVYDEEGFVVDYRIDFDGLESLIDGSTKLLMLCNPQNPGGVCFPKEDLQRLAHICHSRGLIVISDEIHAEMVLRGRQHIPFASVSDEAAACSISFLAPSKTFNIAGVVSSYCVVTEPKLRKQFFDYIESIEIDYPCIFSAEATRAVYTDQGYQWRSEMLAYVESNIDFVDSYLRTNIPCIRAVKPQASFLIWLDCRKLGLEQKELVDLFVQKAGLALNDGTMFGKEGAGFMRLNVGCPRSKLQKALENLSRAVKSLQK